LQKEDLIYNHQDAKAGDYIAYFQSYTNTYAPIEKLRRLYTAALEDELFAGISIATRPDCLGGEVLTLLKELNETYPDKFIWCELGLQTMHETTAEWIRRGYPLAVFDQAVKNLHAIGIPVIVHCIIGLPREDETMVLATIEHLNTLQIDGIKLQLLHYLKDTDLGRMYQEKEEAFHVLTLDEYACMIAHCIGHLDPSIVIHRLTGDGNQQLLLAPSWSIDKQKVLNLIRHKMKEEAIVQGSMRGQENE
jgi:radical SAM protein (TIGR01212 family)